ncbi:MAG: DNA primase small subunit domain-containing protein [Thermoprotei archaeon]
MVSVEERVLLLLSIKESGRYIKFDHIKEKIARDVLFFDHKNISAEEIQSAISRLVNLGLIEQGEDGYAITDTGEKELSNVILKDNKGLNLSYLMTWKAKRYYPKAGEFMLPYLKGRAVSVIKVFSGKSDPIQSVETLFVRYKKYKPKPVPIVIDNQDQLMDYVNDHCVDFIPYVNSLGHDQPDYLILDLDAGDALKASETGFSTIKAVTESITQLLDDTRVNYIVKFSGSRGFQIWGALDNKDPILSSKPDIFAFYRLIAMRVRDFVEKDLEQERSWIEKYGVEEVEWPITTSTVAKKEERSKQVLVDWSSMKPNGDARAPYSLHYKTGLVSLPISSKSIYQFKREYSDPEYLLKFGITSFPPPVPSPPTLLLKKIGLI